MENAFISQAKGMSDADSWAPMKHVTKIVDAIQFIIGGLIQDADKETLKQMDRMQHMITINFGSKGAVIDQPK